VRGRPLVLVVAVLWLGGCHPAAGTTEPQLHVLSYLLDQWKLGVSILGFGGTVLALFFAGRQYRRAEEWKRAEFVAKEMKDFFGDRKVAIALQSIDWGNRHANLLGLSDPADKTKTRVTRALQTTALLPHSIVDPHTGSDGESDADDPTMRRFSPEEAAIRDCYDALLDGLERFDSFLQSKLVTVKALRPYLEYWIDDIAADAGDADDAAWNACLLAYIQIYRFRGVQRLFDEFGYDIRVGGKIYEGFMAKVAEGSPARRLCEAFRREPQAQRLVSMP
jgi:hypothetical protein